MMGLPRKSRTQCSAYVDWKNRITVKRGTDANRCMRKAKYTVRGAVGKGYCAQHAFRLGGEITLIDAIKLAEGCED